MLISDENSMEVSKVVAKLSKLTNAYANAYNADIEALILALENDYDICVKGTTQKVDVQGIIKKYKIQSQSQSQLQTQASCCAVTKNGGLCSRKALDGFDYCNLHRMSSYFTQSKHKSPVKEIDFVVTAPLTTTTNIKDLPKTFTNDEFFHYDSEYMYDTASHQRVGYRDGDDFVLTSDPFLLGHFV